MKHLVSALLHLLLLFISSLIVILIAENALKDSFCVHLEDKQVSIAAAVGIVDIGEEANEETMAEFSKEIFGAKSTTVIELPDGLLDFMNTHEVGGYFAKFLHNYIAISIVAGLLCLICGVGFPFKIGRGKTLGDFSDVLAGADHSHIFSKTYQDLSGKWITRDTYAGENKSCVVELLLLVFYLIMVVIWGLLIVPIVIIDILIFVVALIVGLIENSKAENKNESASVKPVPVQTKSEPIQPIKPIIQTELTNKSLFDYELRINGEVIKLPISTQKLAQMNYKAIEYELEGGSIIEPCAFYTKNFMCINDKTGVRIKPNVLMSCFDDAVDYYRCYGSDYLDFYQITFSYPLNSRINYSFDFFDGIKPGASTANDVYNTFGKPTYASLEKKQYIYIETPEAVEDKGEIDPRDSGFVTFTFDDNDVLTEITVSAKL